MSEGRNRESEPQKKQQVEKKLKLNEEQYKLLLECSKNGDINPWNKYREEHPDEEIWLQGADLRGARLRNANLQGANLRSANLESAILNGANLQGAKLSAGVNLQNAHLLMANLQNADLRGINLKSADFYNAIVDGGTLITSACIVNQWCKSGRFTDFEGVGLYSMRIAQEIKQLLEYNIRRKNWDEWYSKHTLLKWPVCWFWLISDYGLSTWRIILCFFSLSIVFAVIYYGWGKIAPPGPIEFLFFDTSGVAIEPRIVPFRALYFSIVTMTTLGFGDIYANAHILWGHILLSLQVIMGYVLLGALVTRFAVLFTAGGPAGKFAKMNDEKAG
jgi:hypothetical protein